MFYQSRNIVSYYHFYVALFVANRRQIKQVVNSLCVIDLLGLYDQEQTYRKRFAVHNK